ncbi:MAG: nucleotidyltransferase domain-containing protein [Polyangiaceae bacterium]|nr:nucleotidyltransferase domain-containing protein [Polyangiaceae bacterium]
MTDQATAFAETLRGALQNVPGLRLALLFGSAARATLRPDSDLDVGIWPTDPGMTLADELSLATLLGRATGREVDIVRLDRAPAIVRFEVAKRHVVLRADPDGALPRFLAAAALEHAELRPLWDDAQRRLARRLSEGSQ